MFHRSKVSDPIEVKGLAEFPDAKTTRGSKHLIELGEMSKQGHDCYLVYLIQRKDINIFSIAKDIDEEYYKNSIIAKKWCEVYCIFL